MKKIYKDALALNVFDVLKRASKETGIRAYVVGGYVRDYFLGVPNDDIDVVVEGSGIEFAKYISDNLVDTKLNYYENYGTAMIKIDGLEVEFVGARKEMYERGSRNPIVEEGTLLDDQKRRDFTMNAMAFSLNEDDFGKLIDPFNGMEDLNRRTVRSIQNPDITFSDDPLRIFRGIRLYVKLLSLFGKGVQIEEETEKGMLRNSYRVNILTQERKTEEINKILHYSRADMGFKKMYDLDLADKLYVGETDILSAPLYQKYDSSLSIINSFERCNKKDYTDIKWFVLFYLQYKNMENSDYDDIVRKFKLPMSVAKYSKSMSYLIGTVKKRGSFDGMRRLVPYVLGEKWEEFFIAYLSVQPEEYKKKLSLYVKVSEWSAETQRIADEFIDWHCPLNGQKIGDFLSIPEGKELGSIKKKLEEEIIFDRIGNTQHDAYEFIMKFQKK